MANVITSTEWAMSIAQPGQIVQGKDAIKQAISIIMNTPKRSDPLRPRFGVDTLKYQDKPVNAVLPGLRKEILDALTEFEPRIEKIKITATTVDGKCDFKITYQIKNTVLTDQYIQSYAS